MVRRLVAMLGLVLAFVVIGSGSAMAAPSIGAPPPPPPGAGQGGGIDLNPLDNIGGAILNKICPQRKAPYPQSPDPAVMERGGGPGVYAEYGYAGTLWTTYDAGCMSMDKTDTAIGASIDSLATTGDSLTNELQRLAQDEHTTTAFDHSIVQAIHGLRDAFWNTWSVVGLAIAGLLIGLAMATGRVSNATSIILRAAIVVTVVTGVVTTPTLIFTTANAMTASVTTGVSRTLMATTPTTSMPADASPADKFSEAFYQVGNRSWIEGWACGDKDAEKRYANRLRAAQAFSVSEIVNNTGKGELAKLAKAKQADWLKIGKEMAQTNPAAFSCWKGAGKSRTSAAIKHGVVSLGAGFWVDLFMLALLALKWLLRLVMLFGVVFGGWILFSERLADKAVGLAGLALVGPPVIAAATGMMLWGYYAILMDPGQAWWQAGIMAFALGLGLWLAKGVVGSMFTAVSHVGSRASSTARRSGRRFVSYSQGSSHSTTAAIAGAAAGGVAGAVVAGHGGHSQGPAEDHTDSRRERQMPQEPRQQEVDTAEQRRPSPDPAVAYYMGQAHRTAEAKARRDGEPAPWPEPAPAPNYVRRPVQPPVPERAPTTPAPEARHEPAPVAVAEPARPEPEQVADTRREQPQQEEEPEMQHGSIRGMHGAKRHGEWEVQNSTDSRRTDLPS